MGTAFHCSQYTPSWEAVLRGACHCASKLLRFVFDWRQICRIFYLAQLLCANINFQLFNCNTPPGFVKDSGDVLHAPRALQCQGQTFRCGWNVPLGPDHFLSRPSAVVAHRSPLGTAGVPPSVATVRGTAGPEPLATTPMVSDKDSSVVLPLALPGHIRPQWTLEVDPGRYLVMATVGDRNVGFAAYLEVGGQALFSGEWIEAGIFKSRCLVFETTHGAITVGTHCARRDSRDEASSSYQDAASEATSFHSLVDSPPSPSGGGSPRCASPRGLQLRPTSRGDAMARGTRLVSLRVAAMPLAREVERERKPAMSELSQKIAESRSRVDAARHAMSQDPLAERELARATSKVLELQAQKAMKLFSLIAIHRRVTHPYIYVTGETSSSPPGAVALEADR
ncbi:unnamed protein product, partial [Polarella glacialis]